MSSSIKWFVYDSDHAALKISFIHGGVYQYKDVPRLIFEDMQNSDSKGRFFHQRIRNHFRYFRMNKRSLAVLKRISIH